MADIVKFGVLEAPHLEQYEIQNYNGTTFYAYFPNEIRLVSEVLNLRYDLILAEEGRVGYKQDDGKWSGLLGMAVRSEVDVVLCPLSIDTRVPGNVQFSYPYGITDLSFMTNKPEPVSKSLAIIHPFSYSMWIALAVILIVLPIILYIFMNRKVKYQTILFDAFGNLLEQSFSFQAQRNSARVLLMGWLFGAMVISYGYKAVLLSSLSVPRTTVIRDIPDLARAAAEGSVECFTTAGSDITRFTNSTISSEKEIGACLKIREDSHLRGETFFDSKSKKAFISSRRGLSFNENFFYISEDSFSVQLYSFLLSKSFCCPGKFNSLIIQIREAGLDKKFENAEKFFWYYYLKNATPEEPPSPTRKILLSDISGAFLIVISGWISAILTLIGEIFIEKCLYRRK